MKGPAGRLVLWTGGARDAQRLPKAGPADPGADTMTATLPDGSRWTFGGTSRVATGLGTYAWYLTDVVSVSGRQAHLTWTSNDGGRLFLTQAQYGGVGSNYQYQIDFTYETLA